MADSDSLPNSNGTPPHAAPIERAISLGDKGPLELVNSAGYASGGPGFTRERLLGP
jgi:hypothetical protein